MNYVIERWEMENETNTPIYALLPCSTVQAHQVAKSLLPPSLDTLYTCRHTSIYTKSNPHPACDIRNGSLVKNTMLQAYIREHESFRKDSPTLLSIEHMSGVTSLHIFLIIQNVSEISLVIREKKWPVTGTCWFGFLVTGGNFDWTSPRLLQSI